MNNILLLPLIIVLIFWAYREFCHLLEEGCWREERRRLHDILAGHQIGLTQVHTLPTLPPTLLPVPPPEEKLTPAQQEKADAERLQRIRMEELERERMAQLTASSEAGFNALIGTGTHALD